MRVLCHKTEGVRCQRRRYAAYLLRGRPANARLVVRFPDEDRLVVASEAKALDASFLEVTDGELFVLREGGYSIVEPCRAKDGARPDLPLLAQEGKATE